MQVSDKALIASVPFVLMSVIDVLEASGSIDRKALISELEELEKSVRKDETTKDIASAIKFFSEQLKFSRK